MDFLRETWFLLKNVPALAYRYRKHTVFALLSLLLSVGSFLTKNHLFASPSTEGRVLLYISKASLCLTILIFLLAFIDLVKSRLPFSDLVCTDTSVDAYYHIPQAKVYELVQRQKCCNRISTPIRNFAEFSDGYYQRVPQWIVECKLVNNAANVKLKALARTVEERTNHFGSEKILYFYRESREFVPPLPSGAEVDIVYRISARGVAVDESAFHDGTVFYRGVDYDTLNYYLTIHAPVGYEIGLLQWGVFDPGGGKLSSETERQKEPMISKSGGLLHWQISLARKHLRYMLKYRFVEYGWK